MLDLVYIRVSTSALRRIYARNMGPIMLRLGNRIVNNASQRCNVDTGRLRSSLYYELIRNVDFEAAVRTGSKVNYARWVHEGTGPHVIEAKNRKFLKFPGEGGVMIFRRRVNHPGYRGNPFLLDAAREECARL
jgi:hypothetical protein